MYASMYTTYVWCLCQLLCYASQRNRTSLRVLYLTVNITSGSWNFRTLLKKCKSFIFRQKVILQSTASFKSFVTLIFTLWRRVVTWRDVTSATRLLYLWQGASSSGIKGSFTQAAFYTCRFRWHSHFHSNRKISNFLHRNSLLQSHAEDAVSVNEP